jgi:hypothetical protein
MSRFNTRTARPTVTSPVTTTGQTTPTHEGATGHVRDTKSELFLLAVSNLVGQDTFYEQAGDRDDRFQRLVRQLAATDPDWTAAFLGWLRTDGQMRTAALVGAAEFTAERLLRNLPGYSRQVIAAVLQRPDEPGEFLAYWHTHYGRALPKPVKRGLADAVQRLYTGRALLKYDTASKGYRFGDVLELTHPSPHADKPWQGPLFRYALDRRHHPDDAQPPASDTLLTANRDLLAIPVDQRRALITGPDGAERITAAGLTWENLAGWLQGPMDAAAWQAVIPSMGYMALLRNLRNFDQAGVPDDVAETVAKRLADPDEVARSRQFPFRFWAAHKHTDSLRWGHALEKGLAASLANVPALGGRTLILIDRSPSMFPGYHYSTPNSSDITLAERAAVFGSALALRAANPTLAEFGGTSRKIDVPKGGSVLRLVEQFTHSDGTDIPRAVKEHYALGHDRIIIVTDEQTRPGYLPSNMHFYGGSRETAIDDLVPKHVPVYMWNLAGYKPGAMPSGNANRHALGGLTDAAFGLIPLLESGRSAGWPWEHQN